MAPEVEIPHNAHEVFLQDPPQSPLLQQKI